MEKRGILRRHVRLLAVMGNRLVLLGHSGSSEQGWIVHSDCGSPGEASGALWDERRALERSGYRLVAWVDEPAFDSFIEVLAADSTE
jgi:hypothetical protein